MKEPRSDHRQFPHMTFVQASQRTIYRACKGCSRVFNQKACKVCPYCKDRNDGR